MENALRKSYSPYELLSLKFGDSSLGILTILFWSFSAYRREISTQKAILKIILEQPFINPIV